MPTMPIVNSSVALRHPVDHCSPRSKVRLRGVERKLAANHIVEPACVECERHRVDVVDVHGVDDSVRLDVAKQADLALRRLVERPIGPHHDDLGVDAARPQLGYRVLGRLGLQLFAGGQVGNERDVDVARIGDAHVLAHLADRLEKREALDVADRAADLGDHHVDGFVVAELANPCLDLVGDVRDHLDGCAQIVAAPLLADDRLVDRTRRDVRIAAKALAEVPLVVAEIEIGLTAVIGDEHLTVLERVHRAGVDVDVGIELLGDDPKTSGLEESCQRRCSDAFPKA